MGEPTFAWKATGSAAYAAVYDRSRRAFNGPLYVEGDDTAGGEWSVSVSSGGGTLGEGSAQGLTKGSKTDLGPAVGKVMKAPALAAKLAALKQGSNVSVSVRPPDKSAPLNLEVTLRGEGVIEAVQHRVCVMALREDGSPLLGAKAGDTTNDVVGEFSINPKGGRKTFAERDAFADGSCGSGNSSRWATVDFTESMQLTFRYTGSDETVAVRVPAKYTIPDSSGLYEPGSNSCFTVTVTLDAAGNQSRAPKITKRGSFSGGSCQ